MKKWLICATILIFCSCKGEGNKIRNYFPLDEGYRWVYKSNSEGCCELTFTVTTGGIAQFENQDAYTIHYNGAECWGSNGCGLIIPENTEYLFKQNDGIYLIGIIYKNGTSKKIFETPIKVFAFPVEIGTYWKSSSKGTYYRDNGEVLSIEKGVEFNVISEWEVVQVPAGEFTDCIEIKGLEYDNWYRDNELMGGEMTDVELFYAPDAGLVKETIRFYPSIKIIVTIELIEFTGY